MKRCRNNESEDLEFTLDVKKCKFDDHNDIEEFSM